MRKLFVNQNGRIVCELHGGAYLASSLKSQPDSLEIRTPIDSWMRIDRELLLTFPQTKCEECT